MYKNPPLDKNPVKPWCVCVYMHMYMYMYVYMCVHSHVVFSLTHYHFLLFSW